MPRHAGGGIEFPVRYDPVEVFE